MPSTVQPLPRERRHVADYRDELEHQAVVAALSLLPDDHPARRSYVAAETSDSLSLSRLAADRMDVVQLLIDAYMGHSRRIAERSSGAGVIGRRRSTEGPGKA